MTDTTDDLAHLDARIDLIREQRDAMERIAAERAVASDRNLARWTSATDALHKATADLNATREKLTTAEAFRDSLQAEVDGLRVELTSMTIMRDKAHAAHEQAVADWSARGDRLIGLCHALGCPNDQQSCLDAIKALRAEADKLRARPELTVGMYRARIDSLPGRAEQVVALLGPVTLPAQDAAAALWKAIDDQIVVEAEKVRDGSGVDWHSAYSGAIGTRAKAEAIVRAALAKLGAPATTPSKPADNACPHCGAQMDGGEFFDGAEASCPACHKTATCVVGDRGYRWEPADDGKPADVFAGVSIGKLCDAYDCAGACGSADVAPRRYAGVMAVLDALRAKLVAPVDPEEVAREVADRAATSAPHNAPRWDDCSDDGRACRIAAMRATLTAAGIPVTPEAGK